MRELLLLAGGLMAAFAAVFAVIHASGWFSVEIVRTALLAASQLNPWAVAALVVALLSVDILLSVPTMVTTLLAGYFLGFVFGGISAATGMVVAGIVGYTLGRRHGQPLLARLYPEPEKREEMQAIFGQYGPAVLIMCRALPMLPEVSCCLAGINRMPLLRFLGFYSLATVPYALIVAYAGGRSSLEDPTPALWTAAGVWLALWLAWLLFVRKHYSKRSRLTAPDGD